MSEKPKNYNQKASEIIYEHSDVFPFVYASKNLTIYMTVSNGYITLISNKGDKEDISNKKIVNSPDIILKTVVKFFNLA